MTIGGRDALLVHAARDRRRAPFGDFITSPAFIVVEAVDERHTKTIVPNHLWQTGFTDLNTIGWGWIYLSTVLNDFSRYVIASKLFAIMAVRVVTDTLELALEASG